jgi:hypothetical protein
MFGENVAAFQLLELEMKQAAIYDNHTAVCFDVRASGGGNPSGLLTRPSVRGPGRKMKRIILTWLTVLVSLFVSSLAFAASGKQGIAVVVEGADAESVRREIADSIPQGIPVQDSSEFSAALASQGVRGSLADALANPKTRKPTLVAVRKALKQVGLPAALSARSKKVGKAGAREIRVVLVVRAQAEPMIEENIAVSRGDKASAQLQPLLAVPLQDLASAPPPAQQEPEAAADKPKAAAKKEPKEAKKEDEDEAPPPSDHDVVAKKRGPINNNNAMIVLDAGADVGTRVLKYSTIVVGPLRAYLQPGIPAWSVGIQIYPAASQNIPFAKDIGIVARASDSLVFESQTNDGSQSAKGKFTRYAVGARYRIPVNDKADSPLFGVEATYGEWKFDFAGTDQVVLELPAVDYKYIRAGADGRIPFGPAAVFFGAGYMHIMSAGKFGDMFPHESIAGVDAKVGGSYGLTPWLEARASFVYTRVFSSANPQGSDQYIAGGALDQYFVGNMALAALF